MANMGYAAAPGLGSLSYPQLGLAAVLDGIENGKDRHHVVAHSVVLQFFVTRISANMQSSAVRLKSTSRNGRGNGRPDLINLARVEGITAGQWFGRIRHPVGPTQRDLFGCFLIG
ncbi:hypothetical protein BU24DRAFT_405716 [Aaosphaeria arxii CBS 175.79]|uniref:Uncharacterized protein n=1 Tax=Aaosphaeria arxii CBS 175.79 TaxID=1450172 RepID=A0A6A5Y0D8_9PLEO|nr:uncharacterized protein BU24DRAFT_405716 [Aaosphaeria arxii CBS 175.79]KAF2018995.1 hypothetical protein BU24DRAFT_405716 [Aaosphaeria arxii CBS 175.79]